MDKLPERCELVRTTPEFDERSVPAGLLRAHRVAAGLWGRLVVSDGSLGFGFDDGRADGTSGVRTLTAGDAQVIPPERPHHVVVDGPVRFVVEFHRPPVPLGS